MTDLLAARAQMAMSLGFHIIFAAVALASTLLARLGAPVIFEGLVTSRWAPVFQGATGLMAIGAIWGLWTRRFRLARLAAMGQVAFIVAGWGLAQYPYLVYPGLTIDEAAAPLEVLRPAAIALVVGGALIVPAFWYLYRVFKGEKARRPEAAGFSPPESTD